MRKAGAPRGEFVRILLPLEREPGDPGPEEEWIWAAPLAAGRYRLESSPFFAYGLSLGDVVRAEETADLSRCEGVEHKGGHRTMRIALDPDWDPARPELQRFLTELEALGCGLDSLPPQIIALDIPPEVEVAEVVRRLQTARSDRMLIWEWVDPRPS